MSDPRPFRSSARSRSSGSRHHPALVLAALLVAALAGAAVAGLASRHGALAFAGWLDLGRSGDRLAFAAVMGGIGAAAGAALGLWLALSRLSRPASIARGAAGAAAALASVSVAVGYMAFALTTPPPPIQPFLLVQLRLEGEGWTDLALAGAGTRAAIPPLDLHWRPDEDGATTAEAVFPMSEAGGVRAVVLRRGDGEIARFSLDLPGDPPATARFSHWLTPDRRPDAARGVEMRFRIERRVVR
ncbi:hypothetical protein [Phreatobacter cathodiphilus]|uniref:Uncharacterized protein n=1 Tax=Phreatobacter cathodiphilus TaxID=1868589 RepID=A0A2S0N751_9HYPH|nr:hypothetical protein [Phreatobacter cathodiphilus]AVO43989.1 hypothetical protein C6569_02305 [Phreatobacter cathodiphilus]